MKKTKKICTVALLFVLLLGSCSKQQEQGEVEHTNQATVVDEENNHLITLAQVRSEIDSTMEKAKSGGYDKLTFADFTPIVTEEDVITDVKEIAKEPDSEEKTSGECIKEQYQWLCELTGEKVDKSKIKDGKTDMTFKEAEKRAEDGTYPEGVVDNARMPYLIYKANEDEDGYEQGFWIESGDRPWKVVLRRTSSEDLTFVKEYRTNLTDEELSDSYELEDGSCTIKDAIEWAEKYENEVKPRKPGKDMKIISSTVMVYKRENGKYLYHFGMRRSYKGITFQQAFQGVSVDSQQYNFDMSDLKMVDQKYPAFFEGTTANETFIPEGESYDKIISLDRAFTILSTRIGENTKCEVKSAELSYCSYLAEEESTEESGFYEERHDKPVWKIEVENKTDDKLSIFYIGVTDYDGENLECVNFR